MLKRVEVKNPGLRTSLRSYRSLDINAINENLRNEKKNQPMKSFVRYY